MLKLSPSLLSADFANLEKEVREIEKAGADWLHLDVMDGHFVPNISFGYGIIKAIKPHSNLFFDVHLMIENASHFVEDFVKSGADLLTVHYEAERHLHRTINYIKSFGIKAGVSINPHTPVTVLEDIICEVDLVLIMSVNPGFGGQKFIEKSVDKVKKLKKLIEAIGSKALIEIDGGVSLSNCAALRDAGGDVLVAGSAIFGAEDRAARIAEFRRSLADE